LLAPFGDKIYAWFFAAIIGGSPVTEGDNTSVCWKTAGAAIRIHSH